MTRFLARCSRRVITPTHGLARHAEAVAGRHIPGRYQADYSRPSNPNDIIARDVTSAAQQSLRIPAMFLRQIRDFAFHLFLRARTTRSSLDGVATRRGSCFLNPRSVTEREPFRILCPGTNIHNRSHHSRARGHRRRVAQEDVYTFVSPTTAAGPSGASAAPPSFAPATT